jgi:hypothetical protein
MITTNVGWQRRLLAVKRRADPADERRAAVRLEANYGHRPARYRIKQFPIVSFAAATYHKAQGMSASTVVLHSFPENRKSDPLMLYVGRSRARTLAGLHLRQQIQPLHRALAVPRIYLVQETVRLASLQPASLRPDHQVGEQLIQEHKKRIEAAKKLLEPTSSSKRKRADKQ